MSDPAGEGALPPRALYVLRGSVAESWPVSSPLLPADDLGVLRGESVFETFRIAAHRPVATEAHLARLARSANALAISLPAELDLRTLIGIAAGAWPRADGVLRLVATKGGGVDGGAPLVFALLTAVPGSAATARRDGVAAVTLTLGVSADVRRSAPWLLGGVKSTSYAVAMAGARAAEGLGAQDAIWLSSDGELLEATTSNVVLARDGALHTPPATDVGVLAGTTLTLLRELVPVSDTRLTVADLTTADEVLLVSSVRGIAPVVRLDGRVMPIGPFGTALPGQLEELLTGQGGPSDSRKPVAIPG